MKFLRVSFVFLLIFCQLPVVPAFADTVAAPAPSPDIFTAIFEDSNDASKIEKINSVLGIESGHLLETKVKDGSLAIEGPKTVFTVDKFLFAGNASVPSAELEKLAKDILHHPVRMEDIQAYVSEVKRYYRAKGFIASYAYIPPQVLEGNTMTITIVEGKLDDMTISGNKNVSTQTIRSQFSVKPGQIVNYDNFSGDLERLNRHRDIEAKAQLKPGAEPGTTDIDLKVKDKQPVHLSVDTNNLGTTETGKYRLGAGLSHTNVSGRLDEASTRFEWGTHSWAMMADYNTPITPRGTRAGLQASYASNEVGGNFAALNIEGDATTFGVYAIQPWMHKSDFTADWRFGFDMKNVENRLLGFTAGEDDLRILSGGLQMEYKAPQYRWAMTHTLYRGIDALGATDPLEEDGLGFISKPDFLAYRGALTYHRRLWYDTFGLARIVAQASGDSLPASERMRMGGAYSVRGYSENEYSADYGMYANFEFYLPFDKPWAMIPKGWRLPHSKEPLAKELQWVLFLDMGHGGINDAFIGEDASRDFMGAGIGLRWKIYDKTYLRMDLAAPVSGLGGAEPNESDKHSIFYFGLTSELF